MVEVGVVSIALVLCAAEVGKYISLVVVVLFFGIYIHLLDKYPVFAPWYLLTVTDDQFYNY